MWAVLVLIGVAGAAEKAAQGLGESRMIGEPRFGAGEPRFGYDTHPPRLGGESPRLHDPRLGDSRLGDTRLGVGDTRLGVGDTRLGVGDTRLGVGDTRYGIGDPRLGAGDPARLRPGYGRVENPVVLPLVDVTKYWRLWGLQHGLCDAAHQALTEAGVTEMTSTEATDVARAIERTGDVYNQYQHNFVPEVTRKDDPLVTEAKIWIGHDQFERDLEDCWRYVPPTIGGREVRLHDSMHDMLARSLCLPFEQYLACRELLHMPKDASRRFREQARRMRDEATLLLKRMGRPTQFNYYRNRMYYTPEGPWGYAGDRNMYAPYLDSAFSNVGLTAAAFALAVWGV